MNELKREKLSNKVLPVACNDPECLKAGGKFALFKDVILILAAFFLIAKNLQSVMDLNVDPCDDFYQFTCGNYSRAKTFEENEKIVNALSDYEKLAEKKLLSIIESHKRENSSVIRKMKMFYENCIDPGKAKK